MTGTKAYKNADAKVSAWNERMKKFYEIFSALGNSIEFTNTMKKADKEGAKKILEEKDAFFAKMKAELPELYAVFRIDDKTLTEKGTEIITGKRIIID